MNDRIRTVICHDIKGNKYEVSASDLTFRPAVYGVVVNDNKILLSKQWDGYDFPGGGIELGEKIEDALIREVKEETGFNVEVGNILYSNSSFFKLPYKENFVHSIHIYYQCHITGGKLSTEFFDEFEKQYADKPEWISLSKIPEIKIYSSVEARKVLQNLPKLKF